MTIGTDVLKGSVYIAPLDPVMWQNVGYITEPGDTWSLQVDYPIGFDKIDLDRLKLPSVKFAFDGSKSDDEAMRVAWRDPKPLTLTLKAEMLSDEIFRTLTGVRATQKKEDTMSVDRKAFVLKATPVKAEALAHKHIGSLVTVVLPSGAEVTDILEGIHTSRGRSHVVAELQNVRMGDAYSHPTDQFSLDPKSVVQVRRPRPVVATKAARR